MAGRTGRRGIGPARTVERVDSSLGSPHGTLPRIRLAPRARQAAPRSARQWASARRHPTACTLLGCHAPHLQRSDHRPSPVPAMASTECPASSETRHLVRSARAHAWWMVFRPVWASAHVASGPGGSPSLRPNRSLTRARASHCSPCTPSCVFPPLDGRVGLLLCVGGGCHSVPPRPGAQLRCVPGMEQPRVRRPRWVGQ